MFSHLIAIQFPTFCLKCCNLDETFMDRGSDTSLFKSVYTLTDVLIGVRPSKRNSIFQLVFIHNFIVVFTCMKTHLLAWVALFMTVPCSDYMYATGSFLSASCEILKPCKFIMWLYRLCTTKRLSLFSKNLCHSCNYLRQKSSLFALPFY